MYASSQVLLQPTFALYQSFAIQVFLSRQCQLLWWLRVYINMSEYIYICHTSTLGSHSMSDACECSELHARYTVALSESMALSGSVWVIPQALVAMERAPECFPSVSPWSCSVSLLSRLRTHL